MARILLPTYSGMSAMRCSFQKGIPASQWVEAHQFTRLVVHSKRYDWQFTSSSSLQFTPLHWCGHNWPIGFWTMLYCYWAGSKRTYVPLSPMVLELWLSLSPVRCVFATNKGEECKIICFRWLTISTGRTRLALSIIKPDCKGMPFAVLPQAAKCFWATLLQSLFQICIF